MMTPAEKIPANKKDEKLWAYIKASELSLNDEFLKHTCKSSRELAFKADLHTAIIKKNRKFLEAAFGSKFR